MEARNQHLASGLSGRYAIERELGHGGMATVWLARDLRYDRLVALKVLRPELAATLGPERFLREIMLAARLQHPHIVSVYDSGEIHTPRDEEPILWFTMPYIEGESLRDRLRRKRPLDRDEALRIAREAARGLQYAHEHGVIHRDVKPENILLTRDGSTLVADFGIARPTGVSTSANLTGTGIVVGTPTYMSPEQATGHTDLDARTDVYSLGCVLYEMLTGEPPFQGATVHAIVAKHLTEQPQLSSGAGAAIPGPTRAALSRALAKSPADRQASMTEFAEALGRSDATAAAAPRRWVANLRRVADTVGARTGFRSVLLDLVRDDAPAQVREEAVARVRELIQLQHQLTGRDVVVVPVLISTGRVSTEKLPNDLKGLPISYTDEGLLPHSGMARWVEARVRGAADLSS